MEITYSPSVTITLTSACANCCIYCGFREDDGDLLAFDEIKKIVGRAKSVEISEVLIISGEHVDEVPTIEKTLRSWGYSSIVQWTRRVCEYLLDHNLLPHINIGLLSYDGLNILRRVSSSMGLMMEGDYRHIGNMVHPQKNFKERIQNLEWAGQLKIPFTTGILMGLGETQEDRIRSINAILDCCQQYDHVQEIILQKFVPNCRCRNLSGSVNRSEIKELVELCKERSPHIAVQIPLNLYNNWVDDIGMGFDDLGGISHHVDAINPSNPWPPIDEVKAKLIERGYRLTARLPIYPRFYKQGWYSDTVGRIIENWIKEHNEYKHYSH